MPVNLSKGGNVNLNKEAPGLTSVIAGLGWDVRQTDGAAFDLDASVFALNAQGKCASEKDFIFFNNKKHESGSIEHLGDNRTGAGEGDDEQVRVDLTKVPAGVEKLVFAVTIHEAEKHKQSFGQVSKASIRILNGADSAVITNYDLSEDSSTETAMIFGELYRAGAEWKFKAVGQGYAGGLAALVAQYGL